MQDLRHDGCCVRTDAVMDGCSQACLGIFQDELKFKAWGEDEYLSLMP